MGCLMTDYQITIDNHGADEISFLLNSPDGKTTIRTMMTLDDACEASMALRYAIHRAAAGRTMQLDVQATEKGDS